MGFPHLWIYSMFVYPRINPHVSNKLNQHCRINMEHFRSIEKTRLNLCPWFLIDKSRQIVQDHLCFGMDRGMDRGYGSGVWIGLWVQGMDRAVYFDLQLYIVDISWYLLLAIGMPWPALRLELDIETTIDIYLALATWSRGQMNFYVAKKRYCNQARRSSSARPPPKSFFWDFEYL